MGKYKKSKKRTIPRMGVTGGLTQAANNIADEETYKRTGVRPKPRNPYEGGIGGAIEKGFKAIGDFFNKHKFTGLM